MHLIVRDASELLSLVLTGQAPNYHQNRTLWKDLFVLCSLRLLELGIPSTLLDAVVRMTMNIALNFAIYKKQSKIYLPIWQII